MSDEPDKTEEEVLQEKLAAAVETIVRLRHALGQIGEIAQAGKRQMLSPGTVASVIDSVAREANAR